MLSVFWDVNLFEIQSSIQSRKMVDQNINIVHKTKEAGYNNLFMYAFY